MNLTRPFFVAVLFPLLLACAVERPVHAPTEPRLSVTEAAEEPADVDVEPSLENLPGEPPVGDLAGTDALPGQVGIKPSAVKPGAAPLPASPRFDTEFLPHGNERLDYEVGFLWFDRLADGALILEKIDVDGHYRAVLEVTTRGMAAMFTSNRRERYESHMTFGADGYLHSQSFVTRRYKGRGEHVTDRGKALFFDRATQNVLFQRSKNGKLTKEMRLDLPEGQEVYDFLCAYWNLRLGMFGPLIPGTRMVIPSYSFKGASDIVVEVLDADEQEDLSDFPKGGVLCRLYLDEELFETGGGKLYVWFNERRQPGKGIVFDVLGLGDVRGTMVKASSLEAPPVPLSEVEKPIHIESARTQK